MLNQLKSIYYKVRLSEFVHELLIKKYKNDYKKKALVNENEFLVKITKQLVEDGYAISSLDEIFRETSEETFELSRAQKIFDLMESHFLFKKIKTTSKKNFINRYSEILKKLDLDDPFIKMSVSGIFHQIARAYFKQNLKITNIDYWLNYPVEENREEISSQKWHRDYEDLNVLKVFVYLTDVDFLSGNLSYVKKSNYGNMHGAKFLRAPPLGVVVEDKVIRDSFQSDQIIDFFVPKGTVIFVDTSGLHKGGHCKNSNRFLFTSTYTTFAGISPRNYIVSGDQLIELSGEKYIINSLIK